MLLNKNDSSEGGEELIEAALAIKKINTAEYINYTEKAIDIILHDNQIAKGARLKRDIA